MTKTNRTKDRLVVEIPPTLKAWLEQHCKIAGHSMTWVVTKALEQYKQEHLK